MKLTTPRPYQQCVYCIMDTSDPNIAFDDHGVCEYCNNFHSTIKLDWHTGQQGKDALAVISAEIKKEGLGKDFDCIIGLSGGLDSSYTAYVAKEIMGLRPLLFHVDAGWNTDQAVGNIEKLVDGLGLDLYTEVVNWEEMKDLQLAFLKSQIADQDLPQDGAFFSALYIKDAIITQIKYKRHLRHLASTFIALVLLNVTLQITGVLVYIETLQYTLPIIFISAIYAAYLIYLEITVHQNDEARRFVKFTIILIIS